MYQLVQQIIAHQGQYFDEERFSNLQTTHEEFKSRVHVNKNFLDEAKNIRKKFRINKRNPSSKPDYYKKLPQYNEKHPHLLKNFKPDYAQQTSIPNAVKILDLYLRI